ncbi:hypothetical protein [Archangium violaceum]|uniref:hypothetical protein n=1 Tax=Archangium violaceum TaxID=83451 RepID=UPI001EF5A8F3|nr:hypothetical protein [Archangium violaceum]
MERELPGHGITQRGLERVDQGPHGPGDELPGGGIGEVRAGIGEVQPAHPGKRAPGEPEHGPGEDGGGEEEGRGRARGREHEAGHLERSDAHGEGVSGLVGLEPAEAETGGEQEGEERGVTAEGGSHPAGGEREVQPDEVQQSQVEGSAQDEGEGLGAPGLGDAPAREDEEEGAGERIEPEGERAEACEEGRQPHHQGGAEERELDGGPGGSVEGFSGLADEPGGGDGPGEEQGQQEGERNTVETETVDGTERDAGERSDGGADETEDAAGAGEGLAAGEEGAADGEGGGVTRGHAEDDEGAGEGGKPGPTIEGEVERTSDDEEGADEPTNALVEEGAPDGVPGRDLLDDASGNRANGRRIEEGLCDNGRKDHRPHPLSLRERAGVRVSRIPSRTRVRPLSLWERAGVRVYRSDLWINLWLNLRSRALPGHAVGDLRDRVGKRRALSLDLEAHRSRSGPALHWSHGRNLRVPGGGGGTLGENGEQDADLALVPLGEITASPLGDIRGVPVRELSEEELNVGELLLQNLARARGHGVAAGGTRQTPEPFLPAGRAIHVERSPLQRPCRTRGPGK